MTLHSNQKKEKDMTVHIWGIKDPEDFACMKMDGKWHTRYVDYKTSPKADRTFRVKIRSRNGLTAFHPVKTRKDLNAKTRKGR
jgi:hypothetical protein